MTREAVLLCFLAGANSIFDGDKLLTTPNPAPDQDSDLLDSNWASNQCDPCLMPISPLTERMASRLSGCTDALQMRELSVVRGVNLCSNDYLGLPLIHA